MGRSEHVTAAADPASPPRSGRSDTAESATPLIPDDNDVLLPQHLNTEDVNVMKDGENADDYESIGSEADGPGSVESPVGPATMFAASVMTDSLQSLV
ncbi:hypothetical protein GQ600_16566 [Phytophthora cactorum]|nr:hypothetical protein GQ600_16566 [Phytophthora cactorum]